MTDMADREIVTERLIDAPRELVFAAWTDPEQVAKWWGPNGFTNTIHEMDVVFDTAQERDHTVKTFGAVEGAKQTLGRLAAFVRTRDGRIEGTR